MKRITIPLLCLAFAIPAFGGKGMTCERWEYAKLKDSTRKELAAQVCSTQAKAELNEALGKIQSDLVNKQVASGIGDRKTTMREMSEISDARVSCLAASDEAVEMLAKKFKAQRPTCK